MRQVSLAALAAALAAAPAHAQENDERREGEARDAVELGAVDVVEDRAPAPAYGGFDAVASGLVTVGEESIERHETGSGDLLDVLRLVPNVRFSVDQFSVEREDLQDLSPSDISISGGQVYDNTFRLDGVAVDNVMDTTNERALDLDEVAGARPQSVFLDPSLVGGLEVRDSNVSARFGDFSGGVVDVVIRDPGEEFGATLRVGYESDDLVEYLVDPAADRTDADLPPDFLRWRAHATVDMPVNDRFGILFGFGRSVANVDYPVSEGYGGGFRGQRSVPDQVLVKGDYALSDTLELTGSVIYSPYESEAASDNGFNNLITTQGGGLTGKLELAGVTGETEWMVRGAIADSDMSRSAPPNNFNWDSDAPSIGFCSNSSCTEGGFGDLQQNQTDYTLEADLTRPLFGGEFSAGLELGRIDAFKAREEASRAYSRGAFNPDTVCADADDPACIDGEIGLERYLFLAEFESEAQINHASAYVEQLQTFGPVDVRAGLRASRDDFLENTEIAPRLSAVWSITPDWQLTVGANRYYSGDFVGYAIRENEPDFFRYGREPVISGGRPVYSLDDWSLDRVIRLTKYRSAGLDTPYSDEATAALTFPLLNGVGRLKAVQRWHRDQIVSRPLERVEETVGDDTFRRRVYSPSNEGATDYLGLSGEWVGSWRNHTLTLNANWSETTSRSPNDGTYFDVLDPEDLAEDLLIYNDEILSLAELQRIAERENFATPFVANASLQSSWLDDTLRTTFWLYYTGEYETIADTAENETRDGIRYDVYDVVVREPSLRSDFNVAYALPETDFGAVELEVRVSNLFNELPNVDTSRSFPYQRGRSFWLGLNYRY